MPLPKDITAYNAAQSPADQRLCAALAKAIDARLSGEDGVECKIWHRHPVWFLDGNPIVGYHKLKGGGRKTKAASGKAGARAGGGGDGGGGCIRLLFWSGQSFDEPGLVPEGSFKAAEARYTSEDQISTKDLKRWLDTSIEIQWDYKNIVKRKGKLERLK